MDGSPSVLAGAVSPFACPLPHSLRRLGTETKPSAMPEARLTRASEPASW